MIRYIVNVNFVDVKFPCQIHEQVYMYGLKHEHQCLSGFKPNKTHAVSVLNNGFKNEPLNEFIGEVILKINLIRDVKTSKKLIMNSERVFITHKDTIKRGFHLFYLRELLMSF